MTLPVFIGLTLVLFGMTSFLTGQALAHTWRPAWQAVPYGLLLGAVSRFLAYGLFDGELLHGSGYVLNSVIIIALTLLAYRLTQARKMVTQYPWLYEPAGPLGWREKRGA
jgi:branched-chain amino acid transport system ATP-binding protein